MFLNRFVAEPPVNLVAIDESLNLIFIVGMEEAAGDTPR